jgi:hypothetical protein
MFIIGLNCLENSISIPKIKITTMSSFGGGIKVSCDQISLNKSIFSIGPTELVNHGSNSANKRDTASETEANLNAWGSESETTANSRYICEELINSYVSHPVPEITNAKLFE